MIPNINGEFVILSEESSRINKLNIIDRDNLLQNGTLKLIQSSFDGNQEGELYLCISNQKGYCINRDKNKIILSGSSIDNIYNGISTLIQLKKEYGFISDVYLTDYPKYKYREFMLDVARNYFPISELKKIIDKLFLLKINKFHLHLSDDQGFRMESKIFTRLNDIGGKGDFYTQAELKDLVIYAKNRNVEIIPEIDIPGHVGAIISSYPNLSCDCRKIQSLYYTSNTGTLCISKKNVYDFIIQLLEEVMQIFPGKYVHLGGDEVDLTNYKSCISCNELMSKNQIRTRGELVIYFINSISKYLISQGKKVIVWNDVLKYGKLDEEIIIQNWYDYPFDKSSKRELENDRKFIFGSTYFTYFNYPHSLISLNNVYNYLPKINNEKINSNKLLGVSSHMWTEVSESVESLEQSIFPRLFAFSENAWMCRQDYNNFIIRLQAQLKNFDLKYTDINYADSVDIDEIAKYFIYIIKNQSIGNKMSLYQVLTISKMVIGMIKNNCKINDVAILTKKMFSRCKL